MKRFLALQYLRNLLLILSAFCAFYVFIDVLINYKKLNLNSNIFLLYLFFTFISALYFVMPACIMLAMFATKAQLVARNEYIALRSLGLSPKAYAMPQLYVAFFACFCLSALSITQAAYSAEYKDNILKTGLINTKHSHIMLNTPEAVLYVGLAKNATLNDLTIIKSQDNQLSSIIKAASATYVDNKIWQLEDVQIYDFANLKPSLGVFKQPNKSEISQMKSFMQSTDFLKDARVLSQITYHNQTQLRLNLGVNKQAFMHQRSDGLSLKDAFNLISSFSDKTLLRVSIYKNTIFLFFAPLLAAALLSLLPEIVRFSELSLHMVAVIFISLCIFGCLNLLLRFSQNQAINPELGILLPNLAVILISSFFVFKQN